MVCVCSQVLPPTLEWIEGTFLNCLATARKSGTHQLPEKFSASQSPHHSIDCPGQYSSILACAMYVDLNPIRAAIAQAPETSNYTGEFLISVIATKNIDDSD